MLLRRKDSLLVLVDVQEKLTPRVLDDASLIKRCEWMLRLASTLEVPVILSEQYPQGLGGTLKSLAAACTPSHAIKKVHFSCMQDDLMRQYLSQCQKKQIILMGIEAHVCVLQTAFELLAAGYEVYVVVDAVSSRHKVDLKYGMKRMKDAGAHLVTGEMVLFEWLRQAGTDEFRSISKGFL